jgi:DNA-directed RNA polymerase I, II, and III subunit RPABC5
MIIPIRCFTCGNVLASKYESFLERVEKYSNGVNHKPIIISSDNIDSAAIEQTPEKKAMDELNLTRYCCRRHMVSQVDIIKNL